ncbi:ABC transporter substrate-binding protein [Fundicoccus sp. Sow4_H7]|uniref:ABC transporter substrate-binding protein n=1 Tax=Fundicoccus sp. Sow4_H7 TaxID=3438784 RepID=UPI003F914A2B
MKKGFFIKTGLLLSSMLVLAACGDSTSTTESVSSEDVAETTEVVEEVEEEVEEDTETTEEETDAETEEDSDTEEETESEEVAQIEGLPAPGDFSEEVAMQLSGVVTKGRAVDDNWVQLRLEEMFNIDISNVFTDTWNSQETSILVASNELPDVFAFTSGGMTPLEFFQDGLTRSIPHDMIRLYAPNYAAMLDEVDAGLGWRMNTDPENPDAHLSLIGYQGHTEGIVWAPTLRMDWMENLGMEIPEDAEPIGDSDGYERIYMTSHSYTIEELEEILTAFTYDDPDGNGQDDTFGLLPANNNLNWGQTLFGAFGLAPGYNLMEDGELTLPVVSNAYKEALRTFADWYEKGLIDPEWTTLDERTGWEKYQSGSIGYFIAQRTYLAQEAWTDGRAPQNILEVNPDAKLLVTNHEIGPNGDSGQPSYMPVTLLGDNMYLSASVTDEELARFLQMFDFMHYGEEGVWTKYGIPGEHSDWMAEEGNSTLIVRPEFDAEEGEMGFWNYSHRSYYKEHLIWLTHVKTLELMDKFFARPDVVEQYAIRPVRWDLFNETDLAEISSRYGSQMDTLVQEFRMNGITGVIDIEAEWDNYVQSYMDNGGALTLEEYLKAPLVSDLRGVEEVEEEEAATETEDLEEADSETTEEESEE